MAYEKLNLINGEKFSAEHVSYIEDGIVQNALDNDEARKQINQVKSDLGNLRFSITETNLLHVEIKE